MTELEPLVLVQEKTTTTKISENLINNHTHDTLPLFSMAQEGRLDTFISKLENEFEKNKLSDITTSAVMELYEYKVCFDYFILVKSKWYLLFKSSNRIKCYRWQL